MESKSSKTQAKARRWCFTWNNYTSDTLVMLSKACELKKCSYIIFGEEVAPETKTRHLQGYVEFDVPLAMSTVKSRLDTVLKGKSPIHVELCKGTQQENIAYCSKDGQVQEYGQAKEQDARNGWTVLYEFVQANPDMAKVAEAYPEATIRYWNGLEKLVKLTIAQKRLQELSTEFDNAVLKPWQAKLVSILNTKPDTRTVHWYYDIKGNKGKSWLCKYLKYKYPNDCALLTNGKSTDIAHMYNCEPIAIFDFARSNEERINYQIIEQVKDGKVFSPKYDSHTKVCACPHVVCFANFKPNVDALSEDRWKIVQIKDDLLIEMDESIPMIDEQHLSIVDIIEEDF